MYKISELRTKSREELLKLISELKGKLLALRFEAATGQLSETHLPSATKKDIALIFTVLKEQELGIVREVKPLKTKKSSKVKSDKTETDSAPVAEEVKKETETTPVVEEIKKETETTPVVEEVKEESTLKEETTPVVETSKEVETNTSEGDSK